MTKRAMLALADGTTFEGQAFGATGETVGEVVFNTSMTGYQEILTDPSYVGQVVTMAAPEMGNVGTNPVDDESARPHAVGHGRPLAVRGREQLAGRGDARRLPQASRGGGACRASTPASSSATSVPAGRRWESSPARAIRPRRWWSGPAGLRAWRGRIWRRESAPGSPTSSPSPVRPSSPRSGRRPELRFEVVAYDYGLKKAMIQLLVDAGAG